MQAESKQVFRTLLRAVNRHLTRVTGNTSWRDQVRSEFRRHSGEADPSKLLALQQLGRDYAFLLNSVQDHKELLLSYNIGIDREKLDKQMREDTAALVGLKLPKQYVEES